MDFVGPDLAALAEGVRPLLDWRGLPLDVASLAALAAGPEPAATEPAPRSVWADPAHRLGVSAAGDHRWWASGLPR